jgi:hypothetical protein
MESVPKGIGRGGIRGDGGKGGNGDEGDRTLNPRLAKAVLSQLSYVPEHAEAGISDEIGSQGAAA